MKIVGLIGPKGAGKDTVNDLLVKMEKAHGKLSFALPLKQICKQVFGLSYPEMQELHLKEKPFEKPVILTKKHLRDIKNLCVDMLDPYTQDGRMLYNPNKAVVTGLENRELKSPREILQVIGTDYIRNQIYQDWHVKAAFSPKILSKLVKSGTYCVTDVRFPNELLFLMEKFGKDFKGYYIERPEAEERLATATHASELEILKLKDLIQGNVIKNEGTLEDLMLELEDLELVAETQEESEPKTGFRFKSKDGKTELRTSKSK